MIFMQANGAECFVILKNGFFVLTYRNSNGPGKFGLETFKNVKDAKKK